MHTYSNSALYINIIECHVPDTYPMVAAQNAVQHLFLIAGFTN